MKTQYSPSLCTKIEDLMRTGVLPTEVHQHLGIDIHTYELWRKEHSEFDEAAKRGADWCEGW